jgi:hypothetical protein
VAAHQVQERPAASLNHAGGRARSSCAVR